MRDFISDYHERTNTPQNVDDAYCAFVWSVVAQQPEVRIGTILQGAPERHIVTQLSKPNKSKKKNDKEEATPYPLDIIPDAALKSLDELNAEYGDTLRIAVNPERSFVALTGSHIRVYAPSFSFIEPSPDSLRL